MERRCGKSNYGVCRGFESIRRGIHSRFGQSDLGGCGRTGRNQNGESDAGPSLGRNGRHPGTVAQHDYAVFDSGLVLDPDTPVQPPVKPPKNPPKNLPVNPGVDVMK